MGEFLLQTYFEYLQQTGVAPNNVESCKDKSTRRACSAQVNRLARSAFAVSPLKGITFEFKGSFIYQNKPFPQLTAV